MKHFLRIQENLRDIFSKAVFIIALAIPSFTLFAQDITVNKTVVESATECNQFDVTLEIIGNPPPQPQEVVLIIDRSGSMSDGPNPEPIDYAQDAAIDFVQNLFDPANNPTGLNRVAIVSYSSSASLDIGLTSSSGETSVIAAINAITTGGFTNIQSGLVVADNELINNGTFDCSTRRSIVLLTDGVTNRDNNGNSCSDNQSNTICQQNAIAAGVAAQTTTVGGEVYEQSVYSIGLFGAISGSQQTIATNTIDAIQNAGLFTTETGADLSDIYSDILGQLSFAAQSVNGQAIVQDVVNAGFQIINGTISVDKGSFSLSGQQIGWFVDDVRDETITMSYSVLKVSNDVCGTGEIGAAVMTYEDSNCQVVSEVFPEPEICVPCPEITNANIARQGCTNFIDYTATVNQGGCTPLSNNYSWEFFLDGSLVGTANQLSGTFEYTGGDLAGDFEAVLTYNGTYGSGCTLDPVTDNATLDIPSDPEATAVVDNVECNGDSTGNIDLTVTGGTPPYTFAWSNGATTEDLTNVPAGSYNVTITDATGCNFTFINGLAVTQPEPISIQITKINASLSGLCLNGQATATASGGTAPFTYQWGASAGNQTGQTATNLPTGIHTITVTDANGCESEQSVAIDCINDCDAVINVDDVVDVLCRGEATGSAIVSASSIANPGATFTFTWNTTPPQIDAGVTTSTVDNLTAGVYTVSVTIDGTLCLPVEQSITITQPSTALSVTATATDESGPTTGDGTATANATGGTGPYTYSWNPGGATTQTITGLSAGSYTVTVTDANGCMAMATATVNPGTCQNLAVQASSTPATCNGDSDGTATANVTGGSGDFSYSWSPGGATTQTISGLAAGTYTVTVTDNVTLCTATSNTNVNEPSALSSGIAVNNVLCFGDSSGSLDLTVTGGTQPYTFVWSPGGETSEDISGLTAGTYTVEITDANGCTLTDSATVNQPTNPISLIITSQTDVLCGVPGSVTVEASGGTPPYSYSIDGGTPQTSGTFSNLSAGIYDITVTDGNACTEMVEVTILSNCTDAKDDINDTYVNIPVSGNVLTNDTDAEGDMQTVTTTTVTTAQGITVTIDPNTGAYTYTPPVDFIGEDSFQYSIQDDGNPQATDTATVYIEVLPDSGPQNEPPVANADANTTEVDTPVSGNVLVNDYDPDNDPITVTTPTVTTAQGVTVNIDPITGIYTYTPPAGYSGIDTFQYSICDDGTPVLCDTATVIITIIPDNENITVANDDAYNTNPGIIVMGNVLDNDFDPEGDNQTVDTGITPLSGPTNGTLSINSDGSFTYTPNAGFVGNDQFIYEIVDDNFSDGAPARDRATVYITVGGIRNTTDAIDDINDTFVNVPVNGNVLTNDVDFEGDTQTVTTTTVTTVQGVTVNINLNTGAYTYTPPLDYEGEDTFQYTIVDDGNPQATDTATVYIEVTRTGNPDNDPPVANADTNTTEVDTPVSGNVLVNDYDPDGDPITVTTPTVTTSQGVTVNIDPNTGVYNYMPPAGYVGIDTFQYSICDNGTPALCDTAIVTITIIPDNNNITVANDDSYFAYVNENISGNILDNDFDPEGDNQTVNTGVTPISGPTNGTVSVNADGTFTYTPNTDYVGPDEFIYQIVDDGSPVATDYATVHLLIGLEGNTTEAINDINDTFVNLPVSGNVLTNDVDAEGNMQTVTTTTVTTTQGVIVTIAPTGEYTYMPPTDYVGEDTFQYTIVDDGNPQATDSATVYIEVFPTGGPNNEPPVANADTNTTEIDTPVSGNVLVNDYDPDGDTITVTTTTVTTAEGITVSINPTTGAYTYTPPSGYTGVDTFQYTICDNGTPVLCDTATVTIKIIPDNNNITVANDDSYFGYPNMDISGNVLDNDSDPEGDNQLVDTTTTPVSGPSSGTVTINADGTFTYTPNSGFLGTDQFVYEIYDDGTPEARARATVYLTVQNPGNDILAIDDINDTFVNLPVTGSVATNDENADGPAGTEEFTLIAGSGPSNGTLVFNPDGTYTYTPATDFVGEDTFEYQVCDTGNPIACDTAVVTIEVVDDPIIGNDPPIANNDTNTTEVDTPVSGNVIVNDFDPDGDPISVTSNTNPVNGSVTINPDGTYTYIPNLGFEGEDNFEYTICDNGTPALCDTATVTITVIPDNGNITVANDDAYYGEVDTPILGNVLDNDNDPEGDTQTVDTGITPVSGPANGTLIINADGNFTYTPNTGFTGNDQFVYAIQDDGTPQASDQATVYILVEQTPAPSIAIIKTGQFVDGDGDQCADEGETITYTFSVTNQGNVPLGSISVTDPLLEVPNPAVPITFVSGDDNSNDLLDASETWVYTADYIITQIDIDAAVVENQAIAQGTDEDGTTVSDLSDPVSVTADNPTEVALCQNSSISVIKNQTGPAGGLGDVITYDIIVTNTGNTTVVDINITDPNAVITSGNPIASLAPGESATVMAEHEITQPDIDQGYVENIAIADGTAPDGPVSDQSDTGTDTAGDPIPDPETVETPNGDGTTNGNPTDDPTVTTITQSGSMSVIKSQTNTVSAVGDVLAYDIVVTNTGNTTLGNIVVTDANATITGGNPIASLAPGESATVTAEHEVTQNDIDLGYIENIAIADGESPIGPVSDQSDTGTDTAGDPIPDPETVETPNGDGTTNGNPTDDPTVTTITQSPSIDILKEAFYDDGGDCSQPGEAIDYTFTVTNAGNVSIANVVVTDPLLGGTVPGPDSGDTDSDGALDVGETWVYTASYTITQGDIDAGIVENTATVNGTAPDGSTVTATSNAVVTELCQNPIIAIVKESSYDDGGDCSQPGEIIDYTFTVTNEGNVSLTNIEVTDLLLGGNVPGPDSGDTDGDTELDVDETWIYAGSYTITQDDIDAGEVVNTATAEGTAPDGTLVSDESGSDVNTDEPTVTDLCQNAWIAIIKQGTFIDGNGNQCADPGETIEYTFEVVNTGNVTLTDVIVIDGMVTVNGGPLASLAPGVSDTLTFTATYTITQADIDAGQVTNQATAEGTAPDGSTVSDLSDDNVLTEDDPTVTELCQNASIALVKEGTVNDENGNGCTNVEETISYAFTVVNTGNTTITNITIDDNLVNIIGGPIDLAPGETDASTFTAVYSINQTDIDAGFVENQATVKGLDPQGNEVSDLSDDDSLLEDDPTISTLCQQASIALIKTGTVNDDNGNGCADPKETITYNFTVINTGNVTVSNINIDDQLVNVVGGPITLVPGETDIDSFTATYLITQANIDAGFVENQAEAKGFDPQDNEVRDLSDDNSPLEDDPTITNLCQDAQIALIKTGTPTDENDNGCIDIGETIVYDFVVTNLGNVELINVIVTDPMVDVEGGPVSIDAGASDTETFFAIYTVTQEDVDNGFITNQATVEGTDPNGNVVTDLSDDNSNFEDDPTISTLCQDPAISLEKTGVFNDDNGDGIPQEGETISYAFTVTNIGNVTLYDINIEDPLPGVEIVGGPIAILEPGESDSSTFSATYAITQTDIDNGEVVNQAIVTAVDGEGTIVDDESDDPNDLTNIDIDGDGDPDDPTVVVIPNVLPAQFEIFNGITPNGDGLNDFFEIRGIQDYLGNNVKIFNRWGVLVWETDNYGGTNGEENVFSGESNGRATINSGELLPTGTYFYILNFTGNTNPGESTYTGYLYLNR